MPDVILVKNKKKKLKCEECGENIYPVMFQIWRSEELLFERFSAAFCRTCKDFDEEIYAKDLLKFENPKMRDEYVDAHTP
jgi:Zn finger protein HypA/HybF involved in hydrogenase expression